MATLPYARADLAAVDAGIHRVEEKCLSEAAVTRGEFFPRFRRIDAMGFNTPEESLMQEAGRFTQASGLPGVFSTEEMERHYLQMRTRIAQYAKDQDFDLFQRACLAKCAAHQYFETTTHGWERFTGGFNDAVGDCVQSTTMAVDLAHGMGVHAEEGHTAARLALTRGASHAFPIFTIEGREFVMNANWPEPCTFRFSEAWESHRTEEGEFRPMHHVNYAKDYEAAFMRQVHRREAREREERDRAERAPDPSARPGRLAP